MGSQKGLNEPILTCGSFFDVLKKENAVQHTNIAQFLVGRRHTQQRRFYRDVNARLNTVVGDYPNRLTIDYLRAISYNLTDFL